MIYASAHVYCLLLFLVSEYDYGGSHNGLGLLVPRLVVKNDLCERACLCRTNSIKSTHTLPPMHIADNPIRFMQTPLKDEFVNKIELQLLGMKY